MLELLDAAEDEAGGTVEMLLQVPVALRDAAVAATQAGLMESTTAPVVRGLRSALETVAARAILDAHYVEHPEARPDLGDVALMSAELGAHPVAARPDLVRRAADELGHAVPAPSVEEVLAYATGLAAAVEGS